MGPRAIRWWEETSKYRLWTNHRSINDPYGCKYLFGIQVSYNILISWNIDSLYEILTSSCTIFLPVHFTASWINCWMNCWINLCFLNPRVNISRGSKTPGSVFHEGQNVIGHQYLLNYVNENRTLKNHLSSLFLDF